MKQDKTQKMLENLRKVASYMDAFGCEYLLIDDKLVANYNLDNGRFRVYDAKDNRKVSRRFETLLYWDNWKNNKVFIHENVMNVQS